MILLSASLHPTYYQEYNILLILSCTRTLPDPNLSIVSTHPAAAPGTVTLWACLGGRGLDGEKPCDSRTSSDSPKGARPLQKKEKKFKLAKKNCRNHIIILFLSFTCSHYTSQRATLKAGNTRNRSGKAASVYL